MFATNISDGLARLNGFQDGDDLRLAKFALSHPASWRHTRPETSIFQWSGFKGGLHATVNNRVIGLLRDSPELLRKIDPIMFEEVVAEFFVEEGYEIMLTPRRADGGKDIYVYRTDPLTHIKFLVECKRYVPPLKVDVSVARQLYGVVQQEQATGDHCDHFILHKACERFRRKSSLSTIFNGF